MVCAARVIAKPILVEFWSRHPDAAPSLQAWHQLMGSRSFRHLADLRRTFASADRVDGLTVFDIGGNKYRLIVAVHYNRQKVFVRGVMTHAEYDQGSWKRRR